MVPTYRPHPASTSPPQNQNPIQALAAGAFFCRRCTHDGYPAIIQRTRRIDCRLTDLARLQAAAITLDSVEEKMESGEYKQRRWILVLDQSGGVFLGGRPNSSSCQ